MYLSLLGVLKAKRLLILLLSIIWPSAVTVLQRLLWHLSTHVETGVSSWNTYPTHLFVMYMLPDMPD